MNRRCTWIRKYGRALKSITVLLCDEAREEAKSLGGYVPTGVSRYLGMSGVEDGGEGS